MEIINSGFGDEPQKRLLITIHGIRTFGQWQQRLAKLVIESDPSVAIFSYKYGYFSVLAYLFPPLRFLVTWRFSIELYRISVAYPGASISLVAHSFGTHIVAHTLWRIRSRRDIFISNVVLAGSVLKSTFPWRELIGVNVKRVVNDCGVSDRILILSQLFVLFTGMAGRIGFFGATGADFVNRMHSGGHSHYFEKDGIETDDFMLKWWLPVLTTSAPLTEVDERSLLSPLGGVKLAILQTADPIKLLIYAALITAGLFFGYFEPARQAREAETSRELETARRLLEGGQEPPGAMRTILESQHLSHDVRDRALSFWLPTFLPLQEIVDKLKSPSLVEIDGFQYLYFKDALWTYTKSRIKQAFYDRDRDLFFLVDTANFINVYHVPTLKLIQRVAMQAIPPVGDLGVHAGPLESVRLFDIGSRHTLIIGYTENTTIGSVKLLGFILHHDAVPGSAAFLVSDLKGMRAPTMFKPAHVSGQSCQFTLRLSHITNVSREFESILVLPLLREGDGVPYLCITGELTGDSKSKPVGPPEETGVVLSMDIQYLFLPQSRSDTEILSLLYFDEIDEPLVLADKDDLKPLSVEEISEHPFFQDTTFAGFPIDDQTSHNGLIRFDEPRDWGDLFQQSTEAYVFRRGLERYSAAVFAGMDTSTWILCRFSIFRAPKFCAHIDVKTGIGFHLSQSKRYASFPDIHYSFRTGLHVIDLIDMKEIFLSYQPDSTAIRTSYNKNESLLSIVTERGELLIYTLPNGILLRREPLRWARTENLESTTSFEDNQYRPLYVGNFPMRLSDTTMEAIDPLSGKVAWLMLRPRHEDGRIVPSQEIYTSTPRTEKTAMLVAGKKGRLLDAEVGIPLSGWIDLGDFCESDEQDAYEKCRLGLLRSTYRLSPPQPDNIDMQELDQYMPIYFRNRENSYVFSNTITIKELQ